MPTENRSSNTEMVSVPREWAQHYADLLEERCGYEKAEQVTAFLAKPAEQHQGEPIGYVCPRALDAAINGRIGAEQISILKAPNLYINKPLYTHADPGEVERLRAALKFYADREHYHFESGKWDTVSGEPLNILWCGDEPDFIEDGTVARAALDRKPS
ncbi:hypothetical protein WCE03_21440 [Pseudomonas guariconensis]|uniref:hypothetical protein n=1 Tax=Pseudomonas guariconensis TaxID=1288410 RepID=UPI0034D740E5